MFWTTEELDELVGTTVRGKSPCIVVFVWYSGQYCRENRQRGGREGLPGEATACHTSKHRLYDIETKSIANCSDLGIEQHGFIQA